MNVVVKVNIECSLRWGVVSVGITLLGVTHPRCGNVPVGGSHSEPRE